MATLTRYVSPFGSPASMPLVEAERYLAEDLEVWAMLNEAGLLTEHQRRVGAPRLGDNDFRLSLLPRDRDWIEGEGFDVVRPLVVEAEKLARRYDEPYVVASREGRSAAFPARYVLADDDVRWRTQ